MTMTMLMSRSPPTIRKLLVFGFATRNLSRRRSSSSSKVLLRFGFLAAAAYSTSSSFAEATNSKRSSIMSAPTSSSTSMPNIFDQLQDIVGTDAGDRGMKSLIVPGDLEVACRVFEKPGSGSSTEDHQDDNKHHQDQDQTTTIILSGFPCCVNENPPTETDGPPGTCSIAQCALALGHTKVLIATDDCNRIVFEAASNHLLKQYPNSFAGVVTFPSTMTAKDEERLETLANQCSLLVACERSGPAKDGNCYTMRGINMNEKGLVAPLDKLVTMTRKRHIPFIAIGDGGNELGMGKVIDRIVNNPKISNGEQIGCVVAADHLIASSVSNWGGYALAAGSAYLRAQRRRLQKQSQSSGSVNGVIRKEWVDKCVPNVQNEIDLLNRCVQVGCRDGVSGKVEATVDGMPLETSLQCLKDVTSAVLQSSSS